MAKFLKIASVASEVSPYSKSGGLGDVTKSLPKALSQMGHKVSIITPYYGFISHEKKYKIETVEKKFNVNFKNQKFSITIKKLNFNSNLTIYFIENKKLFGNKSCGEEFCRKTPQTTRSRFCNRTN